ncbi:MAG TPA: hypothetical protein VHJ78_07695 [Actinomycetota bacterium]|nr:hypothetical protein [Actinomycetota bacterium]
MNIDQEFFSIVEHLGPIGDIKLRSFIAHPAIEGGPPSGCGCGSDESACCSTGAAEPTTSLSPAVPGLIPPQDAVPQPEAQSGQAPADPAVTPYPKWDPASRAWWVWTGEGWVKSA